MCLTQSMEKFLLTKSVDLYCISLTLHSWTFTCILNFMFKFRFTAIYMHVFYYHYCSESLLKIFVNCLNRFVLCSFSFVARTGACRIMVDSNY